MITDFTLSRVGDGWQFAWTSDLATPTFTPTFRLYRDGRLLLTTANTSAVVPNVVGPGSGGAFPLFEVLDDDTPDAPTVDPDFVTLAWYATAGQAAAYRVERQIDGDWTPQATIDDDGSGYFTWTSGRLEDGQTHDFRVVPVGVNGNDGTAVSFAMLVVRVPDVPAVTYTYNDADGTVTIAAA